MPARKNLHTDKPPLGIRLLHALGKEPDWTAMTPERLAAFRDAENRKRSSRVARLITGRPDRGARIEWHELALPGRALPRSSSTPAST
jgi:acetyl esterase